MKGCRATLFTLFVLGVLPLGARDLWAQDMIFTEEELGVTQETGDLTPPSTQPSPPMPSRMSAGPASSPAAPPPGQWVFTQQYGWVWMPYGESYTQVPTDGSTPTMYLYYPAGGWCWVDAPWVWGWGPAPFFGVLGPGRFLWFGVGFGFGHFQHFGRAGFGHPGFGFHPFAGRGFAGRGFAGRGFAGRGFAGRGFAGRGFGGRGIGGFHQVGRGR